MKSIFTFLLVLSSFVSCIGQISNLDCAHESIIERHLSINPNAINELANTEVELQNILKNLTEHPQYRNNSTYVIPVVLHVFHFGDDGKMGMDQALSGLEILNNDYNGLNDDWNDVDSAFNDIKAKLDITFCLATIDPQGSPTTGIVYYENETAMYNRTNLFQYAWDNYKYLNIYLPKYTQGGPSEFTAYAYYPSTTNTNNNRDGIFYSSIRWGYGDHSELEQGDDWASVVTHEAGHWLDLRHTFDTGCRGSGDLVDDTPLTLNEGIELTGCDNNDYSCGVQTNGENYMDYNHRCKKMFTKGQVDRMTAALFLPSRINLWSEENLVQTGCNDISTSLSNQCQPNGITIYPNPTTGQLMIKQISLPVQLNLYNIQGQLLKTYSLNENDHQIDISEFSDGIYYYNVPQNKTNGKIILSR